MHELELSARALGAQELARPEAGWTLVVAVLPWSTPQPQRVLRGAAVRVRVRGADASRRVDRVRLRATYGVWRSPTA